MFLNLAILAYSFEDVFQEFSFVFNFLFHFNISFLIVVMFDIFIIL